MSNDILEKMAPDKRDRLINSALEEFGRNKFEKASTNTIVKNAGISKGLLYHYFESKDSLYTYLTEFSLKTTAVAVVDAVDWNEPDLLKRIKEIALIKVKIFSQYPHILTFTDAIFGNRSTAELKETIEKYVPDIYQQIYRHNIDFSLFNDNLDLERTIKIIMWTVENLSEEWLRKSQNLGGDFDFEELRDEIDSYLNVFQEVFYK